MLFMENPKQVAKYLRTPVQVAASLLALRQFKSNGLTAIAGDNVFDVVQFSPFRLSARAARKSLSHSSAISRV
jgi:hypothetical protein